MSTTRFSSMGREQRQAVRHYTATPQPCPNCHNIASIVRDWQAFTARNNRRRYQIGSWNNFLRAKQCSTCQALVRLFDSELHFNAFVSISPSRSRDNLHIFLYEKGLDPEELSTRSYELDLLPSKTVNPYGPHYIEADANWVSIERIRDWVGQCDSTHKPACDESWLQINKASNEVIFIDVQMNCLIKSNLNQRYVALSYVWGQQRNIFQTTLSNVNELMQTQSLSKAWERVPATIQDAMILTRQLGIRYLWIDRLCIVQDDAASIQSNIAQMASIYAQSYFTVIATEGDSETGILGVPRGSKPRSLRQELVMFEDLPFLVIHKDVYFGQESDLTQDYDFRGSYEEEVKQKWHQRAWTFQERIISRRSLIFNNNTVFWECGQGVWNELLSFSRASREKPTYGDEKSNDWSHERQLWPNALQYAKFGEEFSKRKLTYGSDALNAFSAITQSLTPSYPGGFFYALPEFMFDIALLWTVAMPYHNTRREMFPSWSWIAWEGRGFGVEGIHLEPAFRDCWGPTFTNDDLRIFRKPVNIWKKKNAATGKMEVIDNTYHIWLNAKEGRVGSLPGWKSLQEPQNITLQKLGFSKGKVSHPFPIASSLQLQHVSSIAWEPFLYARVQTAVFRFAGHPDPNWGTVGLMDRNGQGVGNLDAHDSGGEDEVLGTTGRECNFIAVCKGMVPRWSQFIGDIHFNRGGGNYYANNTAYPPATPGEPFKWVEALWVEWKDQVAYRRGVARIWMDAWNRASPKEVDIVLG